jgi:MFS family permease
MTFLPAAPHAASNPSPEPPGRTRRELLLAMAGIAATVVLVAFDATIVATTLPRVAQALDGLALYAWAGSGYLLATAASIMIFGRLGDLFGRKPLLMASLVIVALGALGCGLAQSRAQLIACRIVQGIGAGMMIATAFAAPADLFPEARERVRWMALISAAFAMASGIGPVLGGAVTQSLGWRAAFFVVPLAALMALLLVGRYFPRIKPALEGARKIDYVGGALLVVGVAAPLAALQLGFGSGIARHPVAALACAIGALVAVGLLVPYERRVATPIFPLRILKSIESRLLNVIAFGVGAVMFILIFYSPLLLQRELGYSPSAAGLLMTPLVVAISVGSMLNGLLFPKQTEPQRLMVLGGALLALGCVLVLFIGSDSSVAFILAAFFAPGLALGLLLPNLTLFIQMLSERRDIGVGSALVQTTLALGSAVGTALVGIIIGYWSVAEGIRIGLGLSAIIALGCAVLAHHVKMKNVVSHRG